MTCDLCGAPCQGSLCKDCAFDESVEGDIFEDAPLDPDAEDDE